MLTLVATLLLAGASAREVHVPMALATPDGPGASVGEVRIRRTSHGLRFTLDLHDLPPGEHGFHVHAKPSCAPGPNPAGQIIPAGGAGGHLDPDGTGHHMGPDGMGHIGDLPRLTVAADGRARAKLSPPRLTDLSQVRGHALMIHVNGDNYSDEPSPLGGGGGRLACGVVPDAAS